MSRKSFRLPQGGLIDRSRPVTFRFDGRTFKGYEGDTLASALLAGGTRLFGRSFKLHRPRGVMTAGPEEPNALVTTGEGALRAPNLAATTIPLTEGLVAVSQNRWPSLSLDLMAANNLAAALIPAGFYYKTFMWPQAFWERVYEPLIRRAAGLGALSGAPDPNAYDRDHAFCDVLVVGAGPAGLSAALEAGAVGARVLLVEQDWRLGGRLLAEAHEIAGQDGLSWATQAHAALEALPNVRILTRTALFGRYDGGVHAAVEMPANGAYAQRYWKVHARTTILAAGAVERPLVFGGNDRPGVMLASAVQAYIHRFAVAPGRRAVVFATTDSGLAVADTLRGVGVEVGEVVDPRRDGSEVVGTEGRLALEAVLIRDSRGQIRRVAADLLATSGGWNPNIALGSHLGARGTWDDRVQGFCLADQPGLQLAGAAAGRLSLGAALRDGQGAGACAASELGFNPRGAAIVSAVDEPSAVAALWHVAGSRGKAFVDLQHDVTVDDIALAGREGFNSVEHLKRYTTLGMGTDQGKTSAVTGQMIAATLTGRGVADAGSVIARPPVSPVSIGLLGGGRRGVHFRPARLTPSHAWAEARAAEFVDVGPWKRARWYAKSGEASWLDTVNREVATVRAAVGLCDVSTLGKIEVCGLDAGAFLDRIYANTFTSLAVGRARYGLMLREDGFVLDDGSTTRLAPDHYFVTTTTVNAGRVMQHMEWCRQVLWPNLDVRLVSSTDHWAQFAVAGPRSRVLLKRLLPDEDLSNETFPHMSARELAWEGLPTRLFRLSFSGELAYEIAVPAAYGEALFAALLQAGEDLGVAPYGTEALGVLRIEKGHLGGGELNGQTTAHDLGLEKLLSRKKDYMGRVLARRAALTDPNRPRLVGLTPIDAGAQMRAGAHVLLANVPAAAANDQGWLSSVAYSPTVGRWIGLALVQRGPERIGEQVRIHDPVRSADVTAQIVGPVFVDPEGTRTRA